MSSPFIDTPEALDAAIATSRDARREKLVRAMRNQKIRTRIAFVCSGCIALFALVAFYFVGDREAAGIIAMMACVTFSVTYFAGKAGMKKAVESLKDVDRAV
jgi:hypothetical protein